MATTGAAGAGPCRRLGVSQCRQKWRAWARWGWGWATDEAKREWSEGGHGHQLVEGKSKIKS